VQGERIIQSLKKSELLRNTSVLISGTAIAQLIPVLLQPVLRRYYTPEAFGAYSVYLSLVGMLAIISSLKYDLAIILPKKDKDAANIFFLTLFISLAFNLLSIIIIVILRKHLLVFLNLPEKYSKYLLFVPLGTFLYSFYQSINYWLTRKKGFLALSINKFIRRGFEGFAQVVFKFIKIPSGIIYGDIIGHFANIISGLYQGWKSDLRLIMVSPAKLKYVANKYSDFPRYNLIPSFMSACSFLLPAILLNKFYSSEYVGYFDLSKLLLSVPLALISTSISSVLLQNLTEKFQNSRSMKKDLMLILSIVTFIDVAEILIILFFGVFLFKLFFGENWGFSGTISQILVWSYAMNFFVASFSAIFISLNKIKMLSVWQIFYFIAILSLSFFKHLSFLNFLKVYVLIEVICYLISIGLMLTIILSYERKIKLAL
jgi:O-antigen/teichoic acid export membrane protein